MLKFLLIFFIVIYLLGYLGRLFISRWIKNVTNQQRNQDVYNQKKEGEVTIETNSQNQQNNHTGEVNTLIMKKLKNNLCA